MAHFGTDIRLSSFLVSQWLRQLMSSLRIFLALAFEVLAGILLAVNAFWDALLIYAIWRCILFVQTSLRCSRKSTRGLTTNGDQKKFSARVKVAHTSLSDDALPRWSKETAIALHERSFPSFPTVQLFAPDAFGYGLDRICCSSATASCGSSQWRLPTSFQFTLSKDLTTRARDADLEKKCIFERSESTSALRCSIENITSIPTSSSNLTWLGNGETPFYAIQLPKSQRICAFLQSAAGVSPNCITAAGLSQSNEPRLNAIVISRPNMRNAVLDAGQQPIVVKDRACYVVGRVHMNSRTGILSISRLGGAVLTRNFDKCMALTVLSSLKLEEEPFSAAAKLALQESFRLSRRPAGRSRASKVNFDAHVMLHGSDGDNLQPLQISKFFRSPPVNPVKAIEIVDSKELSLSVAERLQAIDEEYKQEQPLQQTWWDEDAVLLGDDGEDICSGSEQWKSSSKRRKKSLFSVCKSAMTSLASSLSSKSTR